MRRVLFTFIVVLFIAAYPPSRIEALQRATTTKTVGQGVMRTTEIVWKPIYWTGKGMYKIAEYFVVEMLRPFKAIRDKMIDIWGVTSKK